MAIGTKLKALVVVAIVLLAATAGAYYYISRSVSPAEAPVEFQMRAAPTFIHISPGWGQNVTVTVARTANFSSDVQVAVAGPSWLKYTPIVIHAPATNGSLFLTAELSAPNGTVDVQVAGLATGSGVQTTTLGVTVTGVFNITSPSGTGEVFDTTKVLDNTTMAYLTSFDNSTGTIQFSTATPSLQTLQRGDVVVGRPYISSAAMGGFLQVVEGMQSANGIVTLQTTPATLFDVFRTAQFGNTTSEGSSTSSLSTQSVQPLGVCIKLSCYTGEFTILPTFSFNPSVTLKEGPVSFTFGISGTLGLEGSWGIDMVQVVQDVCVGAALAVQFVAGEEPPTAATVGLGCVFASSLVGWLHFFQISYMPTESMDIYLKAISGGSLTQKFTLLQIMGVPPTVALVPGFIPIFPPFLWLDVSISLDASVSFQFSQAPDLEWNQQITGVQEGFWYCDNKYASEGYCNGNPGWGIIFTGSATGGFVSHGFGPLDSFEVKVGPTIGVDLDKVVAGISGSAAGFLSDPAGENSPGTPTITSPTDGSTINLSNPNFVSPTLFNWTATAPGPTKGQYQCTWFDDKLGSVEVGQSAEGDCNLDSYGPSELISRIIAAGPGVHHITVSVGWTFPETDVNLGLIVSVAVAFGQLSVNVKVEGVGVSANLFTLWSATSGDVTLVQTPIFTVPGGGETLTSKPISVTFTLPTPSIQLLVPIEGATETEDTPFFGIGHASIATAVSSANPDGLIHLCLTQPQDIVWFVGGNYEQDMVSLSNGGTGGAWTGAVATGTGCVPQLTIPKSGHTSEYQITIWMVLGATDPQSGEWYIPEDPASNPLVPPQSVIVNVQPPIIPPTSGASPLTVQITSPAADSGPYAYEQVVPLQGTVSGGTPPYVSAVWRVTYTAVYKIAQGSPASLLNYPWTVSAAACLSIGLSNTDTVTLALSVTDNAGMTQTARIPINLNCAISQIIQPIPSLIASLLTVLFSPTGEQLIAKFSQDWRPSRLSKFTP